MAVDGIPRGRHDRGVRTNVLPLFLMLCACASVPGATEGEYPAARSPMRVEILDAWFVRVDGTRLALDEFVYQSRQNGRAWARQKLSAPKVHLTWVAGAAPQAVVVELMTQLRLAGVKFIELGSQ